METQTLKPCRFCRSDARITAPTPTFHDPDDGEEVRIECEGCPAEMVETVLTPEEVPAALEKLKLAWNRDPIYPPGDGIIFVVELRPDDYVEVEAFEGEEMVENAEGMAADAILTGSKVKIYRGVELKFETSTRVAVSLKGDK